MDRVVILGSASAVPDTTHENTHLLVEAGDRLILVDCPGSPVVRLQQAGIDVLRLTDIILTHFHPDHVSGFASLLMSSWLIGRKNPLYVYGIAPTIERAKEMLDLFNWSDWPGFYPVHFVVIPAEEEAQVLESPSISVAASPVNHMIPTIGLRFAFAGSGKVAVYSCDTEPSANVRRLATGCDVLIHESTGSSLGHTSPEQAGEIATQAGAKSLYLIHYPPKLIDPETLIARARQTFAGPLQVASDFMTIEM